MKIEFFTLKAIQTTYRNKDSFLVKKCCNFIPFEMVDHGNASRIKIIFYIICHICRWVQSPFHNIGCFCQEWHLKKKKTPIVKKTLYMYMYMPVIFHKILQNALEQSWRLSGCGRRRQEFELDRWLAFFF